MTEQQTMGLIIKNEYKELTMHDFKPIPFDSYILEKYVELRLKSEWISPKTRFPEPDKPVIAFGINEENELVIIRAKYIPKFFIIDGDLSFLGDSTYDETTDEYYWPEGWYEWNEMEDTHWLVDFEVLLWMALPELPEMYNKMQYKSNNQTT